MKEIRSIESKLSQALAQIEALEGLSPKDSSCLRILAEEMFSLCKTLLASDALVFEVTRRDERCCLRLSTKIRVDKAAREYFLSISSTEKNPASQGMAGMLCAGLEVLACEGYPEPYTAAWSYEMHTPAGKCACIWTLSQCMECTAGETVRRQWDGMEKSDASFADESMGAYRGKLDMTVTKIV